MTEKHVDKDQLRIGMFVNLDLPWMKHPFMTSSFKIRNRQQLETLKKLKTGPVRVDLEKSDFTPAPRSAPEPDPAEKAREDISRVMWEEKKRRIKVLKERRVRLKRCAKHYSESVSSARKLMSKLMSSPAQAMEEANELVLGMVEDLSGDADATVQLVNLKAQDENAYLHAINVAALALVLGRKLELKKEQLRQLGMAALFHDIGHQQVPYQILHKKTALSKAESELYQRHPVFGEEIAKRMNTLPKSVLDVILQHHEQMDGSGFPQGLKGLEISVPARIVGLVNRYDNLCNGQGANKPKSPYESVSQMYSKEKGHFDPGFLTAFISNLGVYPPGTLVKLEDDRIAVVISINTKVLLKPNVLVYSPDIPQEEALILDLVEEQLEISECLRREDTAPEILDYLNISESVSYYFDPGKANG